MANNPSFKLDDLHIFATVAEQRGFRSAAQKLNLSASYVSERVANFEKQLGVALLRRTTRSVNLTETGQSLLNRIVPLLHETHEALAEAADSAKETRGVLKINVPGAVTVDILPSIIDRFISAYPDIRIELEIDDRFVEIGSSACDAGIRYGEHLQPDMISVPIGPRRQKLALAASPAYLARARAIKHPRDLMEHKCIRLKFTSGVLTTWEFERGKQSLVIDPSAKIIIGVDAAPSAIALAVAGHGPICTFENWLNPYFQEGTLTPLLPQWWPAFDGPRLYFTTRLMRAPLRAFINFLKYDRS